MTAHRSADSKKSAPRLQYSEIADPLEAEIDADDFAWAVRFSMWRARAERASARRTKRAKPQPALTLAGHGVFLRIENGALTIQNGFTHYPQQRETFRYFPGDLSLPERIILIDGSGSVSFDVLSWLAEQRSALFELIGKAILFVLPARRDIPPIRIGYNGNWKPAEILSSAMNIADR